MNSKKRIKTADLITYFVLFLSAVVFVVCGCLLLQHKGKISKETKKNKEIHDEVIMEITTTTKSEDIPTEPEYKVPAIAVDFNYLSNLNEDIIGWIEIPSVNISYPIAQGEDNEYYLRHDVERNRAWSGSIYLDYRCDKNLNDKHSMIYGHNMHDTSMFSELLKYDSEQFFRQMKDENNNYIYIFFKDSVKVYEIFSVVDSKYIEYPESFTVVFDSGFTANDYLNLLTEIQLYSTGILATPEDDFLTLYTCQYDAKAGIRHMIHSKLVQTIKQTEGKREG